MHPEIIIVQNTSEGDPEPQINQQIETPFVPEPEINNN